MAAFAVQVPVAAPVDRVWTALVDWPAHGRWIPVTRVFVTSPHPEGVGATFVGRTGIGPLAFDDPMVVTAWRPPEAGRPGACELRKTGRLVGGTAGFTVEAVGRDRSLVRWREDLQLWPMPLTRLLDPVVRRVGAFFFRRSLRRFARLAESTPAARS